MQQRTTLPETGFVRLSAILAVIPVSKSTFWEKVRTGGFPNPVKLGRITMWRAEDIRIRAELRRDPRNGEAASDDGEV